ncbi:hypothetical protein MKW92_011587, partial [Papaver armeniacum]
EMTSRSHEVASAEVGVMPLEAYGGRIWSYEELRAAYDANLAREELRAAYGANPAQVYAAQQAQGSYNNSTLAASSSSL